MALIAGKSTRKCPVCGSRSAVYLHTMRFALPDASPLPVCYDVVVCLSCGCSFADSDASEENYADYYREYSKYEDSTVATGNGCQPADRIRLEELACSIERYVTQSARIVDVGCANGGLLKSLWRLGYMNLTGLDPSPACVRELRAAGLNAYEFSVASLLGLSTKFNGAFDLVVLSHVIEHVFDVRALLASLIKMLAADGKIYIEVPDAARYTTMGYPPYYFFDTEHINHFSEVSIRNLSASLKLSVLEVGQKKIRLANGLNYTATYGVMKRAPVSTSSIVFDEQLQRSLRYYIAACQDQINGLKNRFLSLVENYRSLAIWGAGSMSQRLMSEPWFPHERLVAIVDRDKNKVGLNFMSHQIQTPEAGLSALPDGAVVCCAAAIAGEQIVKDYQAMGLPYPFVNIVTQDCVEA